MKRFLPALGLAFLALASSHAQELPPAELQRARDHLNKSGAAFAASLQGLSDAQLNFKSDPTRWSVAECAEHIAAAEDFLFGMIQTQVMSAPARTEPANLKELDDFVLMAITDRTKKATAPEPLMPTRRFGQPAATVSHFKESRAKTLAFLNNTKDLRAHAGDSPFGKKLDAYQWILFISGHTERHTKQIEEVKAHPDFPKR